MYRFKKSIPVSYTKQGFIYFKSLLYYELPQHEQKQIVNACLRAAGGEYYKAVFDFVTCDNMSAQAICMKYFISRSTLERAVKKYYIDMAQRV